MVNGLSKSGVPKEAINFDLLDKQAEQIKDTINRLRYMASEPSENLKYTGPTISSAKNYAEEVHSKTPNVVAATRHNKLMDSRDSSGKDKKGISTKFKKVQKERKLSKRKKQIKQLMEKSEWSSKLSSQR